MTCTCSILCAFRWNERGEPSLFASDKAFTGNASGKTSSQVSSESADAFQKKHGYSLGTVTGLSAKPLVGSDACRRGRK